MPQANKPAMFSGPGAQSRRTDGGPASKQAQRYIAGMPNYGDGQELMDLQASAPMASAPQTPAPSKTAVAQAAQGGQPQGSAMPQVTPLLAPTQRPNEPVTEGAASGPGAGPSILGINPGQQGGASARQTVQALAQHPDASPELKRLAAALGQ